MNNILTNPLFPFVIACIIGLSIYGYMYYLSVEDTDEDNNKPVNIFFPLMVSIVSWFIVTTFVKYNCTIEPNTEPSPTINPVRPVIGPSLMGGADILVLNNTVDLHSILEAGKKTVSNINIHRRKYTLPPMDVFTDIAKF